ncbi:MAG: hypothetical protein ACRELY_08045 [Polyangiaceae bacterium]
MSTTLDSLARARKLAQSMDPEIPPADEALPAVRALFAAAKVPFKIVGGIAVVHHGYARATEDIDVLVPLGSEAAIDAVLEKHDFVRESRARLRHAPTRVRVDLLIEGDAIPRAATMTYPSPMRVSASAADGDVISLSELVTLKLFAHRHQDLADVVALLKNLDDAHYLELEGQTPAQLRKTLADLRRDAQEELATREAD